MFQFNYNRSIKQINRENVGKNVTYLSSFIRIYPKVSGLSHNEINNNKHSLRRNTKGYGGKTHYADSQNSDTTAPSGRELYHL
jgi:hypothetical protein